MRTHNKTTKFPKARENAGDQVVIDLHLIDWEIGAIFLDQSQSEASKINRWKLLCF